MSDPEDQMSDGGGLRQYVAKLEQEAKEAKESLAGQIQEAEERGAQRASRSFQAERVFGDLGYPKFADLWVQQNPEGLPQPDGAKEFLAQYGIEPNQSETPPPPPEPKVAPEVQEAAQVFTQPLAPTGGQELMDPDEFRKALRDPNRRDEALKADREGRVQRKYPDIDPRLISIRDDAGFFSGR